MGKDESTPKAPVFTPSSIEENGQVIGSTSIDPTTGQIVTNYTQTPQEIANQNAINQILPTLGNPSQDYLNEIKQDQQNYQNQATQSFMNSYTPMINNQRESYASRFGTNQATPYLDALTADNQNVYNPAMENIAQESTTMGQSMMNQDEQTKLQELQALGYNLNAEQQQFLSSVQAPLNASEASNQFDQNLFNQESTNTNAANQTAQSGTNALIASLGSNSVSF